MHKYNKGKVVAANFCCMKQNFLAIKAIEANMFLLDSKFVDFNQKITKLELQYYQN